MTKANFEELTIPNNTQYLKDVRDLVSRMVRRSGMDRSSENKVVLAVDEAVSNIMRHAYRDSPDGTISLEVIVDPQKFQILIRDTGRSFNPDAVKPPDIEKFVRTGRRQGLGMFLMRRIMDEVHYEFVRGVRNELRMTKYLKK